MLDNKKTEKLMSELKDSSNLYSYISRYNTDFPNISLPDFIELIMQKKGFKKSRVVKTTGLHRTYCYQIMSGKKKPSRDKLIMLAFGLELNIDDTQKLLRIGEFNPLYPKHKRDSIIIYAICNNYSLNKTNMLLNENSEECLI